MLGLIYKNVLDAACSPVQPSLSRTKKLISVDISKYIYYRTLDFETSVP
jgi:hypothetical protein